MSRPIILISVCVALAQASLAAETNTAAPAGLDAEIARLTAENAALQKKYTNLAHTARVVFESFKAEDAAMQKVLERRDAELARLHGKIALLEAKPSPFTPEELALLRKPENTTLATPPADVTGTPEELAAAAQHAFANRDFETAREKYLALLKINPKSVFALGNVATIELELEQTAAAESHLREALAIRPDDTFCLGALGNLCFRQGKYDAAFDALSHAAELSPEDAQIQNFLGLTLCQKGQRAAAEAALRKAIQLDPNYASAHNNLAVIYLTQNPPQVELARWHYQKALAVGKTRNADLEKMLEDADHAGAGK